jgi:hypothetical protein
MCFIAVISTAKFESVRSCKICLQFYELVIIHYSSNTYYYLVISVAKFKSVRSHKM